MFHAARGYVELVSSRGESLRSFGESCEHFHLFQVRHPLPSGPLRRFERELGRKTYTTPTSYLELIKLYLEMLGTQRDSVSTNESRYRNGLQKLEETKVMVNELQVRTRSFPLIKMSFRRVSTDATL